MRKLAPHIAASQIRHAMVAALGLGLVGVVAAQDLPDRGRQLPKIEFRRPPQQPRPRLRRDPFEANDQIWDLPTTALTVASGQIRQPASILPHLVPDLQPARRRNPNASQVGSVMPAVGQPSQNAVLPPVRLASIVPPEGLREPKQLNGKLQLEEAERAAETAHSVDNLSEVIELCERSLRLGLDDEADNLARRLGAWAYNRRGETVAAKDEAAALFDFQQAIQLDPNCWQAIHNRAVSYSTSGQHALALIDYNRVLRLNPDAVMALRNRGELLAVMGRTNAAIDDYSAALGLIPDDPQLFNMRGHAHHRLGRFRLAIGDFNQSIQHAEFNPDAFTNRGNVYAELGYYEQALRDFETAIDQDIRWWPAMRSMAWILATAADAKHRDAAKGIEMAQRAKELSPGDDPLLYDTLAAALASAERYGEAAEVQRVALEVAPTPLKPELEDRLRLYQGLRPYRSQPRPLPLPAAEGAPAAGGE